MLGRPFYLYTGLHSFLIGLFPFYMPVYLYSGGFALEQICLFIAATGAGYCLTLYLFDRVKYILSVQAIMAWSYVSESLLLAFFIFKPDRLLLPLAGVANGMYTCLFWTLQRLLFVSSVTPDNSGRNFGNMQVVVLLVLKVAIVLGGMLLEHGGVVRVVLFSAVVVLFAVGLSLSRTMAVATDMYPAAPLSIRSVKQFHDHNRSRTIFAIDGVFLYLESYFWLISLFVVVRESFLGLGVVTVALAVLFGVLFLAVKNRIDRLPRQRVYIVSVLLYSLSWLLRAVVAEVDSQGAAVLLIAVIAFCTAFFRLSFNKRFFDNAGRTDPYAHILTKSYISQFCLASVFLLMAVPGFSPLSSVSHLNWVYWIAAPAAILFVLYRPADGKEGAHVFQEARVRTASVQG